MVSIPQQHAFINQANLSHNVMQSFVHAVCREDALQMVLQAACGEQVDSRNKAVRLTANKLFSERHLQPPIRTFAQQMLSKLTLKQEIPPTTETPTPISGSQCQHESEEEGSRYSELYCALCTKDPKLLRELLRVYGVAAAGCQRAIEGVSSGEFLCALAVYDLHQCSDQTARAYITQTCAFRAGSGTYSMKSHRGCFMRRVPVYICSVSSASKLWSFAAI